LCIIFAKNMSMTFDDITDDGRLWAVRYDGDDDNALFKLLINGTMLHD
jgi:hypothetical protein